MMSLKEAVMALNGKQDDGLRSHIAGAYPNTLRALRLVDHDSRMPRARKGFNLVKRENKAHGFLYYVRYYHDGMMLPSKWNTRTNVLAEAERFARENRTRLVEKYLRSHDLKMAALLEGFYERGSGYLSCEEKRNRRLSEESRRDYHAVMLNRFIPFLREKKTSCFDAVTALVLADFQDSLLAGGVRPQTANNKLKAVKRVFAYAARKGIITENPCERLKYIPVRQSDQEARGCYELEKLKGAFDKRWEDGTSYALCLLAYATGMRNGEIRRLRKSDIVSIDGRRFIDIKESKTPSGIRLVPLHGYVRGELEAYGSRREASDLLFAIHGYETFRRANAELARKPGVSEAEMKAERVSF